MSENKKIDCRMEWILDLENYTLNLETPKEEEVYEYEICSEVRIPGVLEYGDGALYCALLEEANFEGLYTYKVKIKRIRKEYMENTFGDANYFKNGYYYPCGSIGELIALFSVYFQTRFYHSATITSEMRTRKPFLYKRPFLHIHHEMFSDQGRNWAHEDGLKLFLDTIRKLDEKYHLSFIRACFWYSEAIKEIGVDSELFFIKMVSATEAMLGFIDIPKDDLEEKLEKLKEITTDEQNDIKNWLKNRKVKMKFKKFLKLYSVGFFGPIPDMASRCYIREDKLEKYAGRIYDARSKYIHEGEPMYISCDMTIEGAEYWDLDPGLGMKIDRKRIHGQKKLPRVRWFERITNHCLKKFIENP